MILLDDFLVRAALAGLGIALAAAPLGCFIVWRRMAYFGDAVAHASLLGVALALALSSSVLVSTLLVSLLMAVAVSALSNRGQAMDTLLGAMAHSALAFGLIAAALLTDIRIDLMAYLFGDILAVSKSDLAVIWTSTLAILGLLWWRWPALLTATLNPDLAYAAGINPKREQLLLTVALALVVAVAIKVVGVLLIAAMLIIPASSARFFVSTPGRMVLLTAVFGGLAALGGLRLAYSFDTPTGPTIVGLAAVIFTLANLIALLPARRSPRT